MGRRDFDEDMQAAVGALQREMQALGFEAFRCDVVGGGDDARVDIVQATLADGTSQEVDLSLIKGAQGRRVRQAVHDLLAAASSGAGVSGWWEGQGGKADLEVSASGQVRLEQRDYEYQDADGEDCVFDGDDERLRDAWKPLAAAMRIAGVETLRLAYSADPNERVPGAVTSLPHTPERKVRDDLRTLAWALLECAWKRDETLASWLDDGLYEESHGFMQVSAAGEIRIEHTVKEEVLSDEATVWTWGVPSDEAAPVPGG